MKDFRRLRFMAPLGLLVMAGGWVVADFEVPDLSSRTAAVGSLAKLEQPMQRAFTARDDFEIKKEPKWADWLAQHEEPGQTFSQYLESKPNLPGAGGRKVLYVLPLGEFEKETSPDLSILQRYMELYYTPMDVKVLPVRQKKEVPAVTRKNDLTGKIQWNSIEMLKWLRTQVPRDAYGMIAVTMTDLYPGEGWNFVFGQASYKSRVGIFSFARYHPKLSFEEVEGDENQIAMRRASKVLTHEMGHMFGIKHCIYYECNMNGANSLREADSTPMYLCPVCLRKLQRAVGFDPVARYEGLQKFYQKQGFAGEAKWTKQRVEFVRGD